MKLTGKAKEQFEEWYVDNNYHSDFVDYFEGIHEAMKWGVYQDWADSLGYDLYASKESPLEYFWSCDDLLRSFGEGTVRTRQEARTSAIESLNGLINQNK